MEKGPGPSAAEVDIKRLAHSLQHLERSNKELKAIIVEAQADGQPVDQVLKTAFQDNIVTIAKHRARLEAMERELQELQPHYVSDATPPGMAAIRTHEDVDRQRLGVQGEVPAMTSHAEQPEQLTAVISPPGPSAAGQDVDMQEVLVGQVYSGETRRDEDGVEGMWM
eukprot:CAMPEP_0119111688 /NCGR_PEP_ID=MMETSP1180-20130426/36796_1 /TAXON_ID=3052 ORGANISM="Chlamydomonas cf sp, Strain CCMP681" /NCGR_SAMPLE_ID=MMETSP1180 /ASSEMBLY_ACC=CAM_ASM_000741 /LENGTH=166 /DNA_ID=CAMNT_0007098801 /DNA_START=163 /DNA_END=663 /DNA_ORIENTATION=+